MMMISVETLLDYIGSMDVELVVKMLFFSTFALCKAICYKEGSRPESRIQPSFLEILSPNIVDSPLDRPVA